MLHVRWLLRHLFGLQLLDPLLLFPDKPLRPRYWLEDLDLATQGGHLILGVLADIDLGLLVGFSELGVRFSKLGHLLLELLDAL